MYRVGDRIVASEVAFGLRRLPGTSGVPPLASLTTDVAFDSRFFNDSFFSRCSRGTGAFREREVVTSGLSGDETAGAWRSSSSVRFIGTTEGAEAVKAMVDTGWSAIS